MLILDYSVDRSEAAAIRRWLPADTPVAVHYVRCDESLPDGLLEHRFTHVVHSGSSLSIVEEAPFTRKATAFIRTACGRGLAQFGICYGHQLLCLALIGPDAVRSSPGGLEAGWREVTFTDAGRDFLGLGERETVFQSHFDEVVALPHGAELLATSAHSEVQAYVDRDRRILGTQFHPEFDKDTGDQLFLKDRALLAVHGIDSDEVILGAPSIETGRVFFDAFLSL